MSDVNVENLTPDCFKPVIATIEEVRGKFGRASSDDEKARKLLDEMKGIADDLLSLFRKAGPNIKYRHVSLVEAFISQLVRFGPELETYVVRLGKDIAPVYDYIKKPRKS